MPFGTSWHISVHGRDITDSHRPVGDALEDQRTMERDPLIEAPTQQGTPTTHPPLYHITHTGGPSAGGGVEAGHCFMPWPENPSSEVPRSGLSPCLV